MVEFDHAIPEMETVRDVLDYVRERAKALGPGEWVEVRQVFITRLKEQRYPTKQELDEAAPANPVIFATGPDCVLNTRALALSGIDRDFKVTDGGPGYAEKDPGTGELTGVLRSMTRYVKVKPDSGHGCIAVAQQQSRTHHGRDSWNEASPGDPRRHRAADGQASCNLC